MVSELDFDRLFAFGRPSWGSCWPVRNWGAEEAGGGAFYPSGSESLGQPTSGLVALSHQPIFTALNIALSALAGQEVLAQLGWFTSCESSRHEALRDARASCSARNCRSWAFLRTPRAERRPSAAGS